MRDKFLQQTDALFTSFKLLGNCSKPVVYGKLPLEILNEFDEFTTFLKKQKNHNLYFLKNHLNVGMNKFQASVPTHLFEDSFSFAYLNHLGERYASFVLDTDVEELKRKVTINRNVGHYDHYDLWVNFIEHGDVNEWHTHSGSFSGVIYVDNKINLPTMFKDGSSYNGTRGDIIVFPSDFPHRVEKNTTNKTRITYAFNLTVEQ